MEGINHSCRERPSWSDGGVGDGIKTFRLPFGSEGTLLLADQHTLQHASPASFSPFLSFDLSSLSFLNRLSSAALYAHRQRTPLFDHVNYTASAPNDWRIRCAGEPLRSSRVGGQRVHRLDEREGACELTGEKEGSSRALIRQLTKRSCSIHFRCLFYRTRWARALICFLVICCSVSPSFLDRARANICPSQSLGIIWNKHSRRVINPSDAFPFRYEFYSRGYISTYPPRVRASPVTDPILNAGLTKLPRRRR